MVETIDDPPGALSYILTLLHPPKRKLFAKIRSQEGISVCQAFWGGIVDFRCTPSHCMEIFCCPVGRHLYSICKY